MCIRDSVWDEYAVPCYNIAVDHPYYYHERLADLPKKYYHISIDRLHEAYFKHFYPEFMHRGFLPLAGSRLEELCKLNTGKEEGKQSVEYPAERIRKPVEKKYNGIYFIISELLSKGIDKDEIIVKFIIRILKGVYA